MLLTEHLFIKRNRMENYLGTWGDTGNWGISRRSQPQAGSLLEPVHDGNQIRNWLEIKKLSYFYGEGERCLLSSYLS